MLIDHQVCCIHSYRNGVGGSPTNHIYKIIMFTRYQIRQVYLYKVILNRIRANCISGYHLATAASDSPAVHLMEYRPNASLPG